MNTTKKKAGVAGLIYLAVIITGMFSLAYVPNKLIDWNNSSITFNNIKNAQSFFRIGIYSSVLCYLFFSFLPLALYNLLNTVNETQARTMVLLALLSVPLSFTNLQHSYTALLLTGNDQMIKGTEVDVLATKLMFSLHQYNEGILLITVFWGLWLFPFGLLVYRSGFMPKTLGALLIVGCIGYLINFTGNTLFDNYSQIGVRKYISMLPAIAELSTCGWLLYLGLKRNNYGNN